MQINGSTDDKDVAERGSDKNQNTCQRWWINHSIFWVEVSCQTVIVFWSTYIEICWEQSLRPRLASILFNLRFKQLRLPNPNNLDHRQISLPRQLVNLKLGCSRSINIPFIFLALINITNGQRAKKRQRDPTHFKALKKLQGQVKRPNLIVGREITITEWKMRSSNYGK